MDPHSFADLDRGSQNLADPMDPDPDPKHCIELFKTITLINTRLPSPQFYGSYCRNDEPILKYEEDGGPLPGGAPGPPGDGGGGREEGRHGPSVRKL